MTRFSFARKWFGFTPTDYQASPFKGQQASVLLSVGAVKPAKQQALALRAIWFALKHPKTLTLIVAPSLRQSMILADKLQDFLTSMPPSR